MNSIVKWLKACCGYPPPHKSTEDQSNGWPIPPIVGLVEEEEYIVATCSKCRINTTICLPTDIPLCTICAAITVYNDE